MIHGFKEPKPRACCGVMPNELSLIVRLEARRGMSLRVRVNILTVDVNWLSDSLVFVRAASEGGMSNANYLRRDCREEHSFLV